MAGFTFSTLTPTSHLVRAADVLAERATRLDGLTETAPRPGTCMERHAAGIPWAWDFR